MTSQRRFDQELPAIIADLYLAGTPDYRDDVLGRTARVRQRPAWTFPGRWLPMADITRSRAFVPSAPWRLIAVALVLLALIAGALLVVGSQQRRLPAPFGVAGNGLIAYSIDGDIFTVAPETGVTTAVVTGPDDETGPLFSPDGTRIAFIRTDHQTAARPTDIVVAGADGSDPRVITATPIPGGPSLLEWANDSGSLLAGANDGSAIWLFDATTAADPRIVATTADPYLRPFQPPDGSAILIRRSTPDAASLVRLDLETQLETILATGGTDQDLGAARWSPDGSKVVYNAAPVDDPESQRLFVVNADGTGTRQITAAPGTWFDIDPTWSPDGTQIAFTRYERVGAEFLVRPIGIYSTVDGSVRDVGPLPRDTRAQDPNPMDSLASEGEGFAFDWSPDGKSLIAIPGEASGHPVVIDESDGTWRTLGPVAQPGSAPQVWQRVAE